MSAPRRTSRNPTASSSAGTRPSRSPHPPQGARLPRGGATGDRGVGRVLQPSPRAARSDTSRPPTCGRAGPRRSGRPAISRGPVCGGRSASSQPDVPRPLRHHEVTEAVY